MKFGWFEDRVVVYMLTDFGIDPINITRDRIFKSMSAGMHHIKFYKYYSLNAICAVLMKFGMFLTK